MTVLQLGSESPSESLTGIAIMVVQPGLGARGRRGSSWQSSGGALGAFPFFLGPNFGCQIRTLLTAPVARWLFSFTNLLEPEWDGSRQYQVPGDRLARGDGLALRSRHGGVHGHMPLPTGSMGQRRVAVVELQSPRSCICS